MATAAAAALLPPFLLLPSPELPVAALGFCFGFGAFLERLEAAEDPRGVDTLAVERLEGRLLLKGWLGAIATGRCGAVLSFLRGRG